MKGTSKVIMGATLIMVVSLAIVLGLVLVLLVELYCSLLLRRRRLRNTPPRANAATNSAISSSLPAQQTQQRAPSPLSSFYAHGVLDAPRSFLFPAVSSKDSNAEMEKQSFQLHHSVLDIHTQEPNTSPHCLGIISPSTPSTSFVTSRIPVQETTTQVAGKVKACVDGGGGGGSIGGKHFVYISNPIFDNNASRLMSREDTPFETPDTSPSRLESGSGGSGSSSEEEVTDELVQPSSSAQPSSDPPQSLPSTPPLTPMKKLPAEACSVSLRDARSLGNSGSDSGSNNGHSSSSSGSPCTSPSW